MTKHYIKLGSDTQYLRRLYKKSPTGRSHKFIDIGDSGLSYGTSIDFPEPILTINVGDHYLQLSKSAFEEIAGFYERNKNDY